MSDLRGKDISADRRMGEYWERQFCKMAALRGRAFTPHQIGREQAARAAYLYGGKYHVAMLPDVTLWTRPGEHHEIKHKDPTKADEFGLERYRIDALLWFAEETGQSVHYTIHNYGLVDLEARIAQKNYLTNNPTHWVTAAICDLVSAEHRVNPKDRSIVNGRMRDGIEIWYWRTSLFVPLTSLWSALGNPGAGSGIGRTAP
jgi:hypothetical protein